MVDMLVQHGAAREKTAAPLLRAAAISKTYRTPDHIGRLVLERQFGRVRRTARGSHIVAAVFLVGVGVAHLRQTEWVMTAFNWIVDLFR